MRDWFESEIVDSGKLPLVLCFTAFIVTFAITRLSTRSIRSGKGPFKDQVTDSGVHVHHAVPGLVLLAVGAVTSIATTSLGWRSFAATLIGVGLSLVLDEFALILHLDDVYWSHEGRLSVSIISATAAILGLALIGATPLGIAGVSQAEVTARVGAIVAILWHGLFLLVCILKRKLRVVIFGLFIPVVSFVGAVRLARPGSWWANRFYGEKRLAKATARAERSDARWKPRITRWNDLVGGAPTEERPGPDANDESESSPLSRQ